MKVRCKGCRAIVFVCPAIVGLSKKFSCRNCGCNMYLDSVQGGIFVLGRADDPLENLLDGAGKTIAEDVPLRRVEGGVVIRIMQGESLNEEPEGDRSLPRLRKALKVAESEERYEDCATIRDKIKNIIYHDCK